MNEYDILSHYFGYSSFRPGQEEIVRKILEKRDILAVMPTGAGKSICYQVPALMMEGMTIVISPLISLMKDQVMQLVKAGIRAAYINSSLSRKQYGQVLGRLKQNEFKLVYLAPERLAVDSFIEICQSLEISMVAIDEAHCVSQWGQDFRPEYMNIMSFVRQLPKRPVLAAFTATATSYVKKDIEKILELNQPFLMTTGFDRPNLTFSIERPHNKNNTLLALLAGHKEDSGIIYCATRKEVESVTDLLSERGYNVARYHAGLTAQERTAAQEDFIYDRTSIIVATNAFGMGIDKPNVSFVFHYNMPKSMEAYYQEAGRAGRDGNEAECVLLYSASDLPKGIWMIDHSEPNPNLTPQEQEAVKKRDRQRLFAMEEYATSRSCLRNQILAYFGQESLEDCGRCSNCLAEYEQVDMTIEAQKIMSAIVRSKERYGRTRIVDLLKGSENKSMPESLKQLSVYGVMKDDERSKIELDLAALIEQNYVAKEGLEYPVLKMTRKGIKALKLRESVYRQKEKPRKSHTYVQEALNPLQKKNSDLFDAMKQVRRALAKKEAVPAYIIFTDTTIKEMAEKKPADLKEFARIKGVGQTKLEKYGPIFVKAIQEFLENKDISFLTEEDE